MKYFFRDRVDSACWRRHKGELSWTLGSALLLGMAVSQDDVVVSLHTEALAIILASKLPRAPRDPASQCWEGANVRLEGYTISEWVTFAQKSHPLPIVYRISMEHSKPNWLNAVVDIQLPQLNNRTRWRILSLNRTLGFMVVVILENCMDRLWLITPPFLYALGRIGIQKMFVVR